MFLLFNHFGYAINNSSTWEYLKRNQIPYFKGVSSKVMYPFHKGVYNNLKQLFSSDRTQPVDWALELP